MNWRDHPATQAQLDFLTQFGYSPDVALTKGAASDLITKFKEQEADDAERNRAYHLHRNCDETKQELATADKSDLPDAEMFFQDSQNERLQFWHDSMSDPAD